MNRRNRVRHQWTHRRLGLGAAQPADAALTRTESLLAAVGARRTPAVGVPGDAFEAALFDLVCDVDLTIGLPALEATPVPLTELRTAQPIRRRRQLFSWLIPAATSGVAVVVIAITAVFVDPAIPTSPALAAAARRLVAHGGKSRRGEGAREARHRSEGRPQPCFPAASPRRSADSFRDPRTHGGTRPTSEAADRETHPHDRSRGCWAYGRSVRRGRRTLGWERLCGRERVVSGNRRR